MGNPACENQPLKKPLQTCSTFDLFSRETFLECLMEHARLS